MSPSTSPAIQWRHTVTDHLSIGVLFSYILLALGHCAYLISRRQSFTAWERISELQTLAYNSRPSSSLRNTSGGIEYNQTYGTLGKVRSRQNVNGNGDHVEFIFDDLSDVRSNATNFVPHIRVPPHTWPLVSSKRMEELRKQVKRLVHKACCYIR